jgi:opacity protein-like surface antigen
VVCGLAMSGVAQAQLPVHEESSGYIEAVAQSAFGNVTSQSFGVEGGANLTPGVQVYGEIGQIRDSSPSSLGNAAQLIAGFLSQTQSGVGFSVRQPVTFGIGGLRYVFATTSTKVEPYVMAGFGIARVKKDVTFSVGGTDVTNNLQQFGVVLGGDLSGNETKPMISLGIGATWIAYHQFIVDFQYRFGRVFTSGDGLNTNRAGVGLGVRF